MNTLPETIHRTAELSDCGKYRWTLYRRWSERPMMCWVMANPSTADHRIDDPTIKRCIHFSNLWNFGGFVVVNLEPYRSSSPYACKRWAMTSRDVVWAMRTNKNHIKDALSTSNIVVAAWGNNPPDNALQSVANLAQDYHDVIYCLGKTKSGAPKHPMARGTHRVPDDQKPIVWERKK